MVTPFDPVFSATQCHIDGACSQNVDGICAINMNRCYSIGHMVWVQQVSHCPLGMCAHPHHPAAS
jgi:hypothetical protein